MKKKTKIDPKLPESFETRDVIAGLRNHGSRAEEVVRFINEARLDRLLDENLAEQQENAGIGPKLSGPAWFKHVKRYDKLSRQYDKLMEERFGPDET